MPIACVAILKRCSNPGHHPETGRAAAAAASLRGERRGLVTGILLADGSDMNRVPAIPTVETTPALAERHRRSHQYIRILRWTFRREQHERVVCELALTGEDREYELRVPAEWNPTRRAIERFDDALTAFQRHAMIERTLLDEGWVLDSFDSERVTVH